MVLYDGLPAVWILEGSIWAAPQFAPDACQGREWNPKLRAN